MSNLVQDKVELCISLVHLVSLEQTKVGTAQEMVLVVHNNAVSGGVQQRGLSEQLSLLILVLLFVRLHDVVRSQSVQGSHLVSFKVCVVKAGISSGGLQEFDKVRHIALLVIFQLQQKQRITCQ